jgi:hypothetical protein
MAEQNGDKKRRSRKWLLAVASLTLATVGATILQMTIFALTWQGFIEGETLRAMVLGVLYWWMFVDAAVLSGYGIANVIEKWAPK